MSLLKLAAWGCFGKPATRCFRSVPRQAAESDDRNQKEYTIADPSSGSVQGQKPAPPSDVSTKVQQPEFHETDGQARSGTAGVVQVITDDDGDKPLRASVDLPQRISLGSPMTLFSLPSTVTQQSLTLKLQGAARPASAVPVDNWVNLAAVADARNTAESSERPTGNSEATPEKQHGIKGDTLGPTEPSLAATPPKTAVGSPSLRPQGQMEVQPQNQPPAESPTTPKHSVTNVKPSRPVEPMLPPSPPSACAPPAEELVALPTSAQAEVSRHSNAHQSCSSKRLVAHNGGGSRRCADGVTPGASAVLPSASSFGAVPRPFPAEELAAMVTALGRVRGHWLEALTGVVALAAELLGADSLSVYLLSDSGAIHAALACHGDAGGTVRLGIPLPTTALPGHPPTALQRLYTIGEPLRASVWSATSQPPSSQPQANHTVPYSAPLPQSLITRSALQQAAAGCVPSGPAPAPAVSAASCHQPRHPAHPDTPPPSVCQGHGPPPYQPGHAALPPDWQAMRVLAGMTEFVAVPLLRGDTVIGALQVADNCTPPEDSTGAMPTPRRCRGTAELSIVAAFIGALLVDHEVRCLMGALESVAAAQNVDGLVRGLARHVALFCRMRNHINPGVRVALIRGDATALALFLDEGATAAAAAAAGGVGAPGAGIAGIAGGTTTPAGVLSAAVSRWSTACNQYPSPVGCTGWPVAATAGGIFSGCSTPDPRLLASASASAAGAVHRQSGSELNGRNRAAVQPGTVSDISARYGAATSAVVGGAEARCILPLYGPTATPTTQTRLTCTILDTDASVPAAAPVSESICRPAVIPGSGIGGADDAALSNCNPHLNHMDSGAALADTTGGELWPWFGSTGGNKAVGGSRVSVAACAPTGNALTTTATSLGGSCAPASVVPQNSSGGMCREVMHLASTVSEESVVVVESSVRELCVEAEMTTLTSAEISPRVVDVAAPRVIPVCGASGVAAAAGGGGGSTTDLQRGCTTLVATGAAGVSASASAASAALMSISGLPSVLLPVPSNPVAGLLRSNAYGGLYGKALTTAGDDPTTTGGSRGLGQVQGHAMLTRGTVLAEALAVGAGMYIADVAIYMQDGRNNSRDVFLAPSGRGGPAQPTNSIAVTTVCYAGTPLVGLYLTYATPLPASLLNALISKVHMFGAMLGPFLYERLTVGESDLADEWRYLLGEVLDPKAIQSVADEQRSRRSSAAPYNQPQPHQYHSPHYQQHSPQPPLLTAPPSPMQVPTSARGAAPITETRDATSHAPASADIAGGAAGDGESSAAAAAAATPTAGTASLSACATGSPKAGGPRPARRGPVPTATSWPRRSQAGAAATASEGTLIGSDGSAAANLLRRSRTADEPAAGAAGACAAEHPTTQIRLTPGPMSPPSTSGPGFEQNRGWLGAAVPGAAPAWPQTRQSRAAVTATPSWPHSAHLQLHSQSDHPPSGLLRPSVFIGPVQQRHSPQGLASWRTQAAPNETLSTRLEKAESDCNLSSTVFTSTSGLAAEAHTSIYVESSQYSGVEAASKPGRQPSGITPQDLEQRPGPDCRARVPCTPPPPGPAVPSSTATAALAVAIRPPPPQPPNPQATPTTHRANGGSRPLSLLSDAGTEVWNPGATAGTTAETQPERTQYPASQLWLTPTLVLGLSSEQDGSSGPSADLEAGRVGSSGGLQAQNDSYKELTLGDERSSGNLELPGSPIHMHTPLVPAASVPREGLLASPPAGSPMTSALSALAGSIAGGMDSCGSGGVGAPAGGCRAAPCGSISPRSPPVMPPPLVPAASLGSSSVVLVPAQRPPMPPLPLAPPVATRALLRSPSLASSNAGVGSSSASQVELLPHLRMLPVLTMATGSLGGVTGCGGRAGQSLAGSGGFSPDTSPGQDVDFQLSVQAWHVPANEYQAPAAAGGRKLPGAPGIPEAAATQETWLQRPPYPRQHPPSPLSPGRCAGAAGAGGPPGASAAHAPIDRRSSACGAGPPSPPPQLRGPAVGFSRLTSVANAGLSGAAGPGGPVPHVMPSDTTGGPAAAAVGARAIAPAAGAPGAASTLPSPLVQRIRSSLRRNTSFNITADPGVQDTGKVAPVMANLQDKLRSLQAEQVLARLHDKGASGVDELSGLTILEPLGSGGFGTVFRGVFNGIEVAVKVLCERGASGRSEAATMREAFELAVMTTISHPHIVQVLTAFTDVILATKPDPLGGAHSTVVLPRSPATEELGEPTVVIAMEYCDAGSLADAVGAGRFRQPVPGGYGALEPCMSAIYATLLEIALALRHMHAMLLVHCDLKPANILLKSNMRDPRGFSSKLSDFGLVKMMVAEDGSSGGGGVIGRDARTGTVTHMAPELIRATEASKMDASVDVYAFGVLMSEMLSTAPVYLGIRSEDIRRGVVEGALRPDFPPWSDVKYRALAEACLSADPRARPTSAELVARLRSLLAESGALQDTIKRRPCKVSGFPGNHRAGGGNGGGGGGFPGTNTAAAAGALLGIEPAEFSRPSRLMPQNQQRDAYSPSYQPLHLFPGVDPGQGQLARMGMWGQGQGQQSHSRRARSRSCSGGQHDNSSAFPLHIL